MKRPGQPIDMKSVIKVQEYLDKGLNQYEIARVMNTTRQQVNRWVFYIKRGVLEPKDDTVDT
ncbi:MAG: hypothetical protein WC823_00295 [Parcubacteria group bacterium]|jgi:transcriptional regulator